MENRIEKNESNKSALVETVDTIISAAGIESRKDVEDLIATMEKEGKLEEEVEIGGHKFRFGDVLNIVVAFIEAVTFEED